MITESERERLIAMSAAGQRARQFFGSDFWNKDLGPKVASLQQNFQEAKQWSPDISALSSVDKVAMSTAYYSGASDSLGDLVKAAELMVRDGEQAEARLKAAGGDKK